MSKILRMIRGIGGDDSVSQSPPQEFKPDPVVIVAYARDIEKYGFPLDSGLPSYFRKVADYYEEKEHD